MRAQFKLTGLGDLPEAAGAPTDVRSRPLLGERARKMSAPRESISAHIPVEASEMSRGEDGASGGWVFMDEAERAGALAGPCCAPSEAVQRRFPGIAAAWLPPRRQRLLNALRDLEPPAETAIGRLVNPAHPVVRAASECSLAAYGLFATATLQAGALVGWYSGEVVLSTEVRLEGAYAASFVVDEELERGFQHVNVNAEVDPVVMVDDGVGGWTPARPAVDIDASRLRTKLAFINDHRWDALHQRTDAPSYAWPQGPNVELRQVAVRLHDEEMRCGRCGVDPLPVASGTGGDCDAWWPLMGVYAVEDVAAGTELLLDYGEDYWRRMRQLNALHSMLAGLSSGPSRLDTASIPLMPADAAMWLLDHAMGGRRWQEWRACRSGGRICRGSVHPSLLCGAGVGLMAACDLKQGQVIMAERPLCAVPDFGWGEDTSCESALDSSDGVRCDHCTARIPAVLHGTAPNVRCNGCGVAFCSVACRDEADSRYHQRLCGGCGGLPSTNGDGKTWLNFLRHAREACNECARLIHRCLSLFFCP